MKHSNKQPRQATWRHGAQGGLIGGLMVVSFAVVASQCIQIDSFPKVADYYKQYQDYKDQYEKLSDWADRVDTGNLAGLLPESIQGAAAAIENRHEIADDFYQEALGGLGGSSASPSDYAEASVKEVGGLTRPNWGQSDGSARSSSAGAGSLQQCYQLEMGAGIGYMAQTGSTDSRSDLCSAEGHRQLANQSVRPGRGGAGIAPNTAQAAEVTRSVMSNEYPMLDVIRGDLAWYRDNPEYHEPFRYARENLDITVEEAAQHSASLQRVGAIMAGRGFAAYGYEATRANDTLRATERQMDSATLIANLNLAYDGMARYATTFPKVASMRDSLLDIDTGMIDEANEAERYRIGIELSSMESEMSMLLTESRQRGERLSGALFSGYLRDDGHVVSGDEL